VSTPAAWQHWLPDWSGLDTGSLLLEVGWESSTRHVQCRRLPVSAEVADELHEPVNATLDLLAGSTPVLYSPDLELDDGQYAVIPRDQLDPSSSMLTELEKLTPAEGTKDDLKRSLLFYALAVGPADARVTFIRRSNPRANLARGLVTVFDNELSRVTEPLLSFDLTLIDLVLVAGHGLVALNLKAYERLFRDSPELLARTPAKVQELQELVPMTEQTRAALTAVAARNSRVRSRLLAMLGRGYLGSVTTQLLERQMLRHHLDPAHYLVNGELSFTEDQAMVVMQLLNEDLAFGELTNEEFVINKKSPRQ
jgi:hypothetical protein